MKNKPIPGQIVIMNALRIRGEQNLREVAVKKVGKKYFTIEGYERIKFRLEDWGEESEYSESYKIYESKQEYDDEQESITLRHFFRDHINYGPFHKTPIEKLRAMHKILISE